jgi:heat shock protein HtpX
MGAVAKRVVLFLFVNLLVMLTLGIVLGIASAFFPALGQDGLTGIIFLGSLFGFGGAILSLFISKWSAKRGLGVQVIDPATASGEAQWLVQTVHRLAKQAGLEEMPEVGIWDSPEVNAFCTGPSKNSSLVAVSTGILRTMDHDELEGVLGHELSHAANGDMVTMALIQGVVNSFVFIASLIITNALRGDRNSNRGLSGFFMRQLVFNLVHTVLGLAAFVVVVGPFSRLREYRADAGGAALASKAKMIAGLQALLDKNRLPLPIQAGPQDPALATLMISSQPKAWFSTHPSLEDRIARLRAMTTVR